MNQSKPKFPVNENYVRLIDARGGWIYPKIIRNTSYL